MKTFIYTLSHPITNEVRYVGKTTNIKRRYYDHVYRQSKTYKGNWINSLLKEGLKPVMNIIEECTDNWSEREQYWITQFTNLTNGTSGGETFVMTEAVKEKLRLANTGKNNPNYGKTASEETKKKLSLVHKDKVISQEHKEKLRSAITTKRACLIDGKHYNSIREATIKLGLTWATIQYRLRNDKCTTYTYI